MDASSVFVRISSIMRLRSKLNNDQVNLFYSVLGSLTKIVSSDGPNNSQTNGFLRHSVILALDPEHIRVSARGKSSETDGLSSFVELKVVGGLLLQHQIESAANNVIVLEIDLLQLRTALQSILRPNSTSITIIKLAKRQNQPCLCLETTHDVQINHTVPVRVATLAEVPKPPEVPPPQLQLELMPHHNAFRSLLDRYKTRSHSLLLKGFANGELRVVMHKDGAVLQTYFRLSSQGDNAEDCRVYVDPRKLASCLQLANNSSSALLCLEPNIILLHVRLPCGFSTFYLPVQYSGGDDSSVDTAE